jgi:hypothetical protein
VPFLGLARHVGFAGLLWAHPESDEPFPSANEVEMPSELAKDEPGLAECRGIPMLREAGMTTYVGEGFRLHPVCLQPVSRTLKVIPLLANDRLVDQVAGC